MAELPETWKTLADGTPAPNWVAALQEARHSETRAINEGSRSETVPLPPGWGEMASGETHARCRGGGPPLAGISSGRRLNP